VSGQQDRRCTVVAYPHVLLAAYPHVLQAIMARASDALETREHALETRELSCIARPAKPLFISEAHGQQRVVGHVAAPEPTPVVRRGLEP
jgi:hypothetical protein